MKQLGTKLRELRKLKRLSLKQLAEKAGCASSYLSMIENGKIDPGISRLKKIADSLEITLVDLFQDSTDSKVVIRKHERVRGAFRGSKTRIEILIPRTPDKKMDARLAIIAPEEVRKGPIVTPAKSSAWFCPGAWTSPWAEIRTTCPGMTAFTSLRPRSTASSTRARKRRWWYGSTTPQAGRQIRKK